MNADLSAEVHDREQEIAKLLLERLGRRGVATKVLANLGKLLLDLRDRAGGVRPVEPHARGAILEPVRAMQRGQAGGQSVGDAAAPGRLHLLPRLPRSALVQVRMACAHLGDQRVSDIVRVEGTPLFGHHRVEQYLEQDVTEFLPRQAVIALAKRVVELVRFLDQVGAEGLVRLGSIPLAASPQIAHQRERIFKRRLVLHDFFGPGILCALQMTRESNHSLRAWVEIDLGALRRNGAAIAARAGVPIIPMVKADAYGLGAVEAVRALEALDPWGYGVATVEEGAELRSAGITRPVMLFTPTLADELRAARDAGLTLALSDAGTIREWAVLGGRWHLAIDTGMGRAGIRWDDVQSLDEVLRATPPDGACTHFHSADVDAASVAVQEQRFGSAIAALPACPRVLHAENGAAIERRPRSRWDAVRPGIWLYGVGGGPGSTLTPEAVVSVRARVVDLRTIEEGETVSYLATYSAPSRRRIATLSIGYADGYRRALGNRGAALVGGRKAPVVGVVTMDMTMIDVTDAPCEIGDIATLIGGEAGEGLHVADVARAADLSPYEILTGLRGRLSRVYTGGPS